MRCSGNVEGFQEWKEHGIIGTYADPFKIFEPWRGV
jgi:hypothetical protein